MPARSGQQYINNLSNNTAEVWIGGEKVKDVYPPGIPERSAFFGRPLRSPT